MFLVQSYISIPYMQAFTINEFDITAMHAPPQREEFISYTSPFFKFTRSTAVSNIVIESSFYYSGLSPYPPII